VTIPITNEIMLNKCGLDARSV